MPTVNSTPTLLEQAYEKLTGELRKGRTWPNKKAIAEDLGLNSGVLTKYKKHPELWRLGWLACGYSPGQIQEMEQRQRQSQRSGPVKGLIKVNLTAQPEERLKPVLAWLQKYPTSRIPLERAVQIVGYADNPASRTRVVQMAIALGLIVVMYRDTEVPKGDYNGPAEVPSHAKKVPCVEWLLANNGLPQKPNFWYAYISAKPWACDWSPGCPQRGRGRPIA